jgi:hypothetical protein
MSAVYQTKRYEALRSAHAVYLFVSYYSEQTAIVSLNCINLLVLIVGSGDGGRVFSVK